MEFSTKIELAAWVVALLAGTVTPVLTGLITKLNAHAGTKAFIAVLLTAGVAIIDAIVVAKGEFILQDIVILFVMTFTWHVATYFGVWKPVGGGVAPGARSTAEIGLG
jgi:dolichyl-phosphate-mannose--protein O-mannosyl transferase